MHQLNSPIRMRYVVSSWGLPRGRDQLLMLSAEASAGIHTAVDGHAYKFIIGCIHGSTLFQRSQTLGFCLGEKMRCPFRQNQAQNGCWVFNVTWVIIGDTNQCAHSTRHSTEFMPLKVHHDIAGAPDKKCIAALVLLELFAAFDVIDHGIH